ncbi:Ribonuclease/ribotoxin [Gymnopilus junonius]|uniref:Ribonuclease/ribotoxin n=1 Tax=Gymnopilus junonius TaxID=109634 RepID=A0A9P5NVR4_GYMJU|nr:Ribonuclease/ribotoxin [Gymnopilus junonius]
MLTAASIALGASLERRDTFVTCRNTAVKGGSFQISNQKAEGNIHAAPLTNGGTKSGYPHQFTNAKKIQWPNPKCNNLASGVILLEFPVFADGHLYNADSKPKDDPGAARGIFTSPNKDYCGVVAHKGIGQDANKGDLLLCV